MIKVVHLKSTDRSVLRSYGIYNVLALVVKAMLEQHGEYRCTIDGTKYHFILD